MVLWDEQRQTLWLARDRFGKKPLYYLRRNDALLVASEPKALRLAAQRLQLPGDRAAVREHTLRAALRQLLAAAG